MENNIIQKDPFIDKENNMNLLNINSISPFSFIKQISNTKNNQNIYNSKLILSNNISSNNINDQETNEKTYSFKPKKQETPNFSTKEEKILVSDFLLMKNNNINTNIENKNKNDIIFTEILKTKIELNVEEKQKKYLEEIDEKKRKKNMKEEIDKRCKNLRESIEMNRKKLLENIKKMKDEKK